MAYVDASKTAESCGARDALASFAGACRQSTPTLRCDIVRLHRELASGTDIYEPYRNLEELRLRVGGVAEPNFEVLRGQAEIALFGNEKWIGRLHYACLTLDGVGLPHYGNCIIVLSEEMVGHRASCFEGNSAVLFDKHRDLKNRLRSDWDNRHKLCCAKCLDDIISNAAAFSSLLCKHGRTPCDDEFVEVHVFGDMTARTFESVEFADSALDKVEQTYRDVIEQKLAAAGM